MRRQLTLWDWAGTERSRVIASRVAAGTASYDTIAEEFGITFQRVGQIAADHGVRPSWEATKAARKHRLGHDARAR